MSRIYSFCITETLFFKLCTSIWIASLAMSSSY